MFLGGQDVCGSRFYLSRFEREHGLSFPLSPESRPHQAVRCNFSSLVPDKHRLNDVGEVSEPLSHSIDPEPVSPGRSHLCEILFRHRPRMADSAGQFLEVNGWNSRMLGIRCPQTASG